MNAIQRAIFPAILIGSVVVACVGLLAGGRLKLGDVRTVQAAAALDSIETEAPRATATPTSPAAPACEWGIAYPEQITQWCDLLERAAGETGLDASLLAAVMLEESGGNPLAVSKDGAVGLLQVMPRDGIAAGFMCPNGPCFAARPSSAELQDPEFNLLFGAKTLAGLVRSRGSVRDGLLAYGPVGMGYAYADAVLGIQSRYR